MTKTISTLITDVKRAERRLVKHVKPLVERLNKLNMHVYWDGEYKQWFLNRFSADDRGGISFWLDERKFKKLMAMDDTELHQYCENWSGK